LVTDFYNPLDERNLADTLVRELVRRECLTLAEIVSAPFDGSGIYAIYYSGTFALYAPVTRANLKECGAPIYVGKASPEGARKGLVDPNARPGRALHKRLREHAETIQATDTLRLQDFRCRYLLTSPLWLALGETLLIRKYLPVWNTVVDGFGNHPPGGRRSTQHRPEWDTIHPGRSWAAEMRPSRRAKAQIEEAVAANLQGRTASKTTRIRKSAR
jgi:hypothetical protein